TRFSRDWSSDVCSSDLPFMADSADCWVGKPIAYHDACWRAVITDTAKAPRLRRLRHSRRLSGRDQALLTATACSGNKVESLAASNSKAPSSWVSVTHPAYCPPGR